MLPAIAAPEADLNEEVALAVALSAWCNGDTDKPPGLGDRSGECLAGTGPYRIGFTERRGDRQRKGGAMDRFDAMQVLLAVVDAGSLSAGSRKLNAPLPSVSRKVAELERHLGTRLLVRTSRNIQLTDAGRDYVEAARQIMAQIEDAELRASGEYETPRGVLTITMPISFGHDHILPLAYDFLADHPEITLNVLCLDRAVSLVDEHVDVGIRLGELGDSSLQLDVRPCKMA